MPKLHVFCFSWSYKCFATVNRRSAVKNQLEKALATSEKYWPCLNLFIYKFSAVVETRITFNPFSSGFL